MSVRFNEKIGGIIQLRGTSATTAVNNTTLGVMGYGHGTSIGGYSIERHIPGLANVITHFSGVPDFEYNSKGEILVIAGDIMPDHLEERALCEK